MTSTLQKFCCAIGLTATVLGSSVAMPTLQGLASAAPAKKSWVAVMTDRRNNVWYVDSGSIQGKGRFRYFWSYVTGGSPYAIEGKLTYGMAYYLSVDCQEKRFRIRYIKALDENSRVIKDYSLEDIALRGKAMAGSGGEASINYVCSRR